MWEVTARYERERRGGPPYHPRMMVKVLLYGYCVGVASSRRIAQRLHEDIAFRVLAANNTPDFRTISDFRKDNLDALSGLFVQVLALCQQAGLVKLGHVALDGTKVKANASKHKAMSYQLKEKAAQFSGVVGPRMMRKTGGDRGDELRRSWPPRASVGEDTGSHGGLLPNRPRPKVVSTRTRHSRYQVAYHPRTWRKGLPASVQLSGGGSHQVIVGPPTRSEQQAAAMIVGAVPRETITAVDEL